MNRGNNANTQGGRQNEKKQQEQQVNAPDNTDMDRSNTVKDPDEWTTGSERMTGAQRSYLKTMSDEAGEDLDDNLTKAEASKKIDELQQKTGRGQENNSGNE